METGATDIFPLMLIRTAGLPLQWAETGIENFASLEKKYGSTSNLIEVHFQRAAERFENEKERVISDKRLEKIIVNYRRFLRKGISGKEIKVDEYLTEQRPDLADDLFEVNKKIFYQAHLSKEIREWYESALLAEKQALRQYASSENLCRALLLGSHTLLRELPRFALADPEKWNKKERRVASSLLKYLMRATVKTTPFSRLATVSLQDIQTQSSEFSDLFSAIKPVATPNVGLLPFLYEILLREPAFYNSLNIRLNPSLHAESGHEEWLYYNGAQESFQNLESNKALEIIKAFLKEKPARFPDVLAHLATGIEAEQDSLQSFVFQLIDYGYLEWVLPETGLLPGWCGSLYNYLGFLPTAPVLTDAAYLLQWLRTAARTLSFQSVQEAMETQRETVAQCRLFFERYGSEFPDIPPEQIFYEDVADTVQGNLPQEAVEKIVNELRTGLKQGAPYSITGLRAELIAFGTDVLQSGDSLPFLSFCKLFLERKSREKHTEVFVNQIDTDKIGALLQFYQTTSGEYKAVLNALYPGGGKMMARWLNLFPAEAREKLQTWWPAETLIFPWQEWTNANFQPHFAAGSVSVPGGRVGAAQDNISISDLIVRNQDGVLQLLEKNTLRRIVFTDLGLEAPESRPPVMQILWQLGTPYVSAAMLGNLAEWKSLEKGVEYRERIEYQSLVVSRASWHIASEIFQTCLAFLPGNDVNSFLALRKKISEWRVPRYFFAASENTQPRFFDCDSPLLMQEFARTVRETTTDIVLSEMLPAPDEWMAEKHGLRCAAEWALEFRSERVRGEK